MLVKRTNRPEWVEKYSSYEKWSKECLYFCGPGLQDLPHFHSVVVKNFIEPALTRVEATAYNDFATIRSEEIKRMNDHFNDSEWIRLNTGIERPRSNCLCLIINFYVVLLLTVLTTVQMMDLCHQTQPLRLLLKPGQSLRMHRNLKALPD